MECNKIGYPSKKIATTEAGVIVKAAKHRKRNKNSFHVKKLSPYACRHCGQWHLTSSRRHKKYKATYIANIAKSKRLTGE